MHALAINVIIINVVCPVFCCSKKSPVQTITALKAAQLRGIVFRVNSFPVKWAGKKLVALIIPTGTALLVRNHNHAVGVCPHNFFYVLTA